MTGTSQARICKIVASSCGWAESARRDENLELVFVISGTGVFESAGTRRQLTEATVLWSFPGDHAQLQTTSPAFAAWVAKFSKEVVERVSASFAPPGLQEGRASGTVARQLSPASATRLSTLFETLYTAPPARTSSNQLAPAPQASPVWIIPNTAALSYLLVSAWAELDDPGSTSAEESSSLHPAVEKAVTLLRSEACNIPLSELAKRCGTSPTWLSRLFRKQTGSTLVHYRNQQRLERFFRLYKGGKGVNISQAALEAGFGSYAQFHRIFRRSLGYGPAELRRRLSPAQAAKP